MDVHALSTGVSVLLFCLFLCLFACWVLTQLLVRDASAECRGADVRSVRSASSIGERTGGDMRR